MTPEEARRVLHLGEHYTVEDIRQSYRDLVKVWHPDRFVADTALRDKAERSLQNVNAAYAVLQRLGPPPRYAPPPKSPAAETSAEAPSQPQRVARYRRGIPTAAMIFVAIGAASIATLGYLLVHDAPAAETVVTEPAVQAPPPPLVNIVPERRVVVDPLRPESGTELLSLAERGRSALVVRNQSERDAAVLLSFDSIPTYALYVRAGEQVQAVNVPAGEYEVLIASGSYWREGRFTRGASYAQLAESITVPDSADITRITLPRQAGGGSVASAPFLIESGRR